MGPPRPIAAAVAAIGLPRPGRRVPQGRARLDQGRPAVTRPTWSHLGEQHRRRLCDTSTPDARTPHDGRSTSSIRRSPLDDNGRHIPHSTAPARDGAHAPEKARRLHLRRARPHCPSHQQITHAEGWSPQGILRLSAVVAVPILGYPSSSAAGPHHPYASRTSEEPKMLFAK